MMDTESIYKGMGEVDLGEKVIQLQEEKSKLLEHVRKLEADVERLCQEIIIMKKDKDALSKNISELFNTAKREIDRKNESINQLREQLDDVCFRRNRAPYNGSREDRREFSKNNHIDEVKCATFIDKRNNSKSPQHSQKEKTTSKTPVRQRSRSPSSSKNCHKINHSQRDYDKKRSPNMRKSRSRSPYRSKRRRSSSRNHHGSRPKRGPFQRRRSRSREYSSKGHQREEYHHSLTTKYREKKQNIRNFSHRNDSKEVESDQEISNQRIKEVERKSSKHKHYLLQEFENLYNEDIDIEAGPSPFTDKAPFKCAPHDQIKSDDNCKANSLLTEIYRKSESLISEGNSIVLEGTLKTMQKDCESNKSCLGTTESSTGIFAKDSLSVKVKDSDPNSTNTSECIIENGNSSNVQLLTNTENKNCSTSMTAIQTTQQSIGRRRRRCVLKIKE